MKQILLTKSDFSEKLLNDLRLDFEVETQSFIQIQKIDLQHNTIQNQSNSNYIITSKHAAYVVKNLDLNGDFYCVGKSAKNILNRSGKKVKFVAENAQDLAEKIKSDSNIQNQNWVYFCGNLRLNTIPDLLNDLNLNWEESICYETQIIPQKINTNFDAYVFFSPSGVKGFFESNSIPEKAIIFTLGKTTEQAVKQFETREIYTPEKSTINNLFELIKTVMYD